VIAATAGSCQCARGGIVMARGRHRAWLRAAARTGAGAAATPTWLAVLFYSRKRWTNGIPIRASLACGGPRAPLHARGPPGPQLAAENNASALINARMPFVPAMQIGGDAM
jgi:hypothetical protein